MCGISGIFGFSDKEAAHACVQQMNRSLAHRGPDADGIWSNEKVVLGHRRLSIIDTSDSANQPMRSADDRLVIVFNGELYNYRELRNELQNNYSFGTQSDTEVVLAAYVKWGIGCLQHFNGMFAFAMWDNAEQCLWLVRDRLGVKPLYYTHSAQGLAFASEMRALMDAGLAERKLNTEALPEYLAYQTVHAPRTLLRDVHMLMPGCCMKVNAHQSNTHTYWQPGQSAVSTGRPLNEIQHNILHLLRSSVELRMRADVPFGAFLSGGIDSSAVVALMSENATQPVSTYSVTFSEQSFDESQWSQKVANHYGTHHHEIKLSASQFVELVPEALQATDHPGGDGPNTYVVSKVTRASGIKMAMSGIGGDELFAGYPVFVRLKKMEHRQWLRMAPRFMRQWSGKALSALQPGVASDKLAEVLEQKQIDFAHLYPLMRKTFSERTLTQLLGCAPSAENAITHIAALTAALPLPLLAQVSVAEISTYLQNVLLRDTDQMSMAHALEVREPFLDYRLVEYVLALPDEVKYPHTPKQLLVQSLGTLLPPGIAQRPKMGFVLPWAQWMKKELCTFCEDHLKELDNSGHLAPGSAIALWNQFLQNDPRTPWSRLWHLVALSAWMKQHHVS